MEATISAFSTSKTLKVVTVVVLILSGVAAWHQIKLNRMQIAKLKSEK